MKTAYPVETWIARSLQFGVFTATIFVIFGGILFHYQSPFSLHHEILLTTHAPYTQHWQAILMRAYQGNALAIIDVGILVLIWIQIVRMLLIIGLFIRDRQPLFVLFSTIILGLLCFSLLFKH